MNIKTHTFAPTDPLSPNILFPQQTHGARIVEIVTGQEDLADCDGLWARDPQFLLGVKTADCAPICLWTPERYGVLHAGWRGLINGAVENMLTVFKDEPDLKVWVGPLYPQFQIQRDECYDLIQEKFGDQFFQTNPDDLLFNFRDCLQHLLPPPTVFDPRSTFDDKNLASWRRDKAFPKGQNSTIIGIYSPPTRGS